MGIFGQGNNFSFHENVESFQYTAALTIKDATKGTSKEKLYQ